MKYSITQIHDVTSKVGKIANEAGSKFAEILKDIGTRISFK